MANEVSPESPRKPGVRPELLLFLASCATLYFELVIIRYLASEVRVFAYLKNMPLIASFLGIGLGMILGRPRPRIRRAFPALVAALFLLIANSSNLSLTHLALPTTDYLQFSFGRIPISPIVAFNVVAVLYFLTLVVGVFVVLGGYVGEYVSQLPPLRAYGINLAGSLAGILLFTLLAFMYLPPWSWLLIGFVFIVPFFAQDQRALAIFVLVVVAVALARPQAMWSPYYRITLQPLPVPAGWSRPSGYVLNVNYDYFQKALDLSPEFIRQNPNAEPNRSALPHYELPYRLVEHPANVLIVGAGTGNDVAAALRHGAKHIDAVEIDPLILELGWRFHPEHPYASSRVTLYNDDARAFLKKAKQKYDLIVFGYLDSHTLLSSYSSVRLENYVYTLESFQEAKRLLAPAGTMVVAFASGNSFVTDRLYATLDAAFSTPPLAYQTGYDETGVVFVEGRALDATAIGFPEISNSLKARLNDVPIVTDSWPFLFLIGHRIPASMLFVLLSFVTCAVLLCRYLLPVRDFTSREPLHMFFLGAGFLLLETKGVTELSLLFGSTWITNTVVIAAFLTMAILANTVVMFRSVPRGWAFSGLFVVLVIMALFPYSALNDLPPLPKVLAAGALTALPAFFSGLIFSQAFREANNPAEALGMNLLGAVVGGTLENLVMIGGTPILGVLAIMLYAGAAAAQPKGRKVSSAQAVPITG